MSNGGTSGGNFDSDERGSTLSQFITVSTSRKYLKYSRKRRQRNLFHIVHVSAANEDIYFYLFRGPAELFLIFCLLPHNLRD